MSGDVWIALVALPLIGLAGCIEDAPTPAVKSDMEYREEAAVDVIRLGFQRWQIACALAVGRRGGSQKDAERICMADFELGTYRP